MEINAVKIVESAVNSPVINNNENRAVVQKAGLENDKLKVQTESVDKAKEKDKKELTKDEINEINGVLNTFMNTIDSDLHFVLHDKTKELMLQVVDRRDNKVVKEIPSRDMLDVIARIRESVGALFDKRA